MAELVALAKMVPEDRQRGRVVHFEDLDAGPCASASAHEVAVSAAPARGESGGPSGGDDESLEVKLFEALFEESFEEARKNYMRKTSWRYRVGTPDVAQPWSLSPEQEHNLSHYKPVPLQAPRFGREDYRVKGAESAAPASSRKVCGVSHLECRQVLVRPQIPDEHAEQRERRYHHQPLTYSSTGTLILKNTEPETPPPNVDCKSQ